jgi:hypothetical protein
VSNQTKYPATCARRDRGRLFAFCLLLALTLVTPGRLGAQEERIDSPYRWIPRGLRVGLQGAYLSADRGNLEFAQGPTMVTGARFRVRVSSPLSLELGASYATPNRWVVDPRLETGPAVVDTVSSNWLSIEAGVQLGLTGARTWHGFHPYAVFGGGFLIGINEQLSDTFAEQALEPFRYKIGTAPELYGGLGFEIFPSGKIGLAFEFRDHLTRIKTPDGFFQPDILQTIADLGLEAPTDTQWLHNLEFSATLWYYF